MPQSKKILISGGNGNLAKLIAQNQPFNNFVLLVRDNAKIDLSLNNVVWLVYDDFFKNKDKYSDIDLFIHCAFARNENTKDLLDSLALSAKLFDVVNEYTNCSIINISSMSVYSSQTLVTSKETEQVCPSSFYGFAKANSELLLSEICKSKKYTNIRLAATSGFNTKVHILTKFVRQAIQDKQISIVGGSQNFCFMDERDAVEALSILINSSPEKWERAYNLSSNEKYNIVDMAEFVSNVLKSSFDIDVVINLEKNDKFYFNYDVNADLFMQTFNWKPKYNIVDTIKMIANVEIGKK